MKTAPIPAFEDARMVDLRDLNVLNTPREERFDRLTDLAKDIFDVDMAFVTIVDADRQWFKSTCGLSGVDETPHDVGFCAHAIAEPAPLIVPDATKDERFADNPFVTGDFGLRFYAGAAVRGRNGQPVGTLCLVGTRPRDFGPRDIGRLEKLASLVQAELQRH